jgi:hypothetical protein
LVRPSSTPTTKRGSRMETTLLTAGLACLIASIIGGGLKAFSIEIPVLTNWPRQIALFTLGLVLCLIAFGMRPAPTQAVRSGTAGSTATLNSWEKSWECTLRFSSGGRGVLRFGPAAQDLMIHNWSLELDGPFDRLMYRSSTPRDAFWFGERQQITFHLLKEGSSVKRVLNVRVNGIAGDQNLTVDGLYKTEDKREPWSGTCRG